METPLRARGGGSGTWGPSSGGNHDDALEGMQKALDEARRELALARIPKTLWVHGSGTEECNGPYDLVRGGEIYAQSGGHAWEHRNMRFVIRRGVGESNIAPVSAPIRAVGRYN